MAMNPSVTAAPPKWPIRVSVDGPYELFDRFDPSSFVCRHLDEGIEQFIVHRADEKRSAEYVLIVQVGAPPPTEDVSVLTAGIRGHFAHRAEEEAAKLRGLVSDGKRDLMTGFVFLFICGVLGLLAAKLLPPTLGRLVEEGFVIIGWVALWRPVDLFLYELRPVRRSRKLLSALSKMEVAFEAA